MDIIEVPDEYRVDMDLPGVELATVEVTPGPVRGTLRVVTTIAEPRDAGGRVLLSERAMRSPGARGCARTIPIAWDADVENVKRTLNNGVLRLSIPKIPPQRAKENVSSASSK